jgi:AraC-like DNA-binding protein
MNLPEQLAHAKTIDEQISILSSYLSQQQQSHKRHPDDITKFAISQLTQTKGIISLKELQQQTQLSERSLERKFKDTVGISPKMFSRIIRFQETLNQMRSNKYDKLSDIAYENDYADQAHFIRVFKEFTGFSPLEFKRQSSEDVENFPQIKK